MRELKMRYGFLVAGNIFLALGIALWFLVGSQSEKLRQIEPNPVEFDAFTAVGCIFTATIAAGFCIAGSVLLLAYAVTRSAYQLAQVKE